MKQSSRDSKMKQIGKIIVCALSVSIAILLFYNSKISESDTALASIKTSSKPINNSSNINFPVYNHGSQDLFVQKFVLKNDSRVEVTPRWDIISGNPIKISTVEKRDTKPLQTKVSTGKEQSSTTKKKVSAKTEIKQESNKKLILPSTKKQKVVYLTFDDGPSTATMQILTLLKKYQAQATFFMLDPNLKKYSSSAKQIVKNGNSVGSHGVTHDIHKVYRSPAAFVQEMKQTEATLKKITGKESHLIRAPYGSVPYMTPDFRKASDAKGFILWDWDIDSDDWKYPNGQFVQKIKTQVDSCSSDRPLVVLMHDKTTTAKYLEQVLQYFQKKGYKMVAIDESLQPVQFKYRKN
ncbi:polysaccharide deacetylase family protein [Bacillus sp. FJAT-49736]|uniref:polysaccharide deacetylase family protein n=1 Tax=Bacillus sp. FJAT-49736 TaxID=2833582 RepID=UPI001BC96F05|nr:polysaccharide deacetylase family protein [Bacillus sp. FJAT-49736]MBS4173146.1 polysaccharide deacetylase family protein [Bacillus sp. FJAT-49736]